MMKKLWYSYAPIAYAATLTFLYWKFPFKFPAEIKDLLSASISFGSITTGFLATAISILMALPSDSVMGRIKRSGYIDDLVSDLRLAFYSSLGYSLYNLIGFFISDYFLNCYRLVWIFSTSLVFFTLRQVAGLMILILKK